MHVERQQVTAERQTKSTDWCDSACNLLLFTSSIQVQFPVWDISLSM